MDASKRAIGLLDSGVGGLTVAREIFKLLPQEDIVYYGDTLHLPYGPKNLKVVQNYVEKIIQYLVEKKKVKAVVIACNTATSAALNYVQTKFEIPIFGMIKSAAVKAVSESKKKKIAVIGTEGTINSQAYQKAILALDSDVNVYSEACPEFVTLVEKGNFSGREVENTANKYLKPLIKAEVDSLILGCTHFPYLSQVLAETMGENVDLINPAYEMAVEVKKDLKNLDLLQKQKHRNAEHNFIVSDKEKISRRFLEHGRRFLELEDLEFEEDNIFLKDKIREAIK